MRRKQQGRWKIRVLHYFFIFNISIKFLKTIIPPITQKGAKQNITKWNIRSGVAAPKDAQGKPLLQLPQNGTQIVI
jgi:hypothetical protein